MIQSIAQAVARNVSIASSSANCNSCITPFVPEIYQTEANVARAVARSKKACKKTAKRVLCEERSSEPVGTMPISLA
jgi:hypothetical protein